MNRRERYVDKMTHKQLKTTFPTHQDGDPVHLNAGKQRFQGLELPSQKPQRTLGEVTLAGSFDRLQRPPAAPFDDDSSNLDRVVRHGERARKGHVRAQAGHDIAKERDDGGSGFRGVEAGEVDGVEGEGDGDRVDDGFRRLGEVGRELCPAGQVAEVPLPSGSAATAAGGRHSS